MKYSSQEIVLDAPMNKEIKKLYSIRNGEYKQLYSETVMLRKGMTNTNMINFKVTLVNINKM